MNNAEALAAINQRPKRSPLPACFFFTSVVSEVLFARPEKLSRLTYCQSETRWPCDSGKKRLLFKENYFATLRHSSPESPALSRWP